MPGLMWMTTGLVRLPDGTDMMAACTLVNWPLPSAATTNSVGLTAVWPGMADRQPTPRAEQSMTPGPRNHAIRERQMFSFMSGQNGFNRFAGRGFLAGHPSVQKLRTQAPRLTSADKSMPNAAMKFPNRTACAGALFLAL